MPEALTPKRMHYEIGMAAFWPKQEEWWGEKNLYSALMMQ